MDTFVCPKGHISSDADYCSECGAKLGVKLGVKIGASASAAAAPVSASTLPSNCPDCGAPREQADAIFCDVCGFNFQTGAHGGAGNLASAPEPQPAASEPAPAEPVPAAQAADEAADGPAPAPGAAQRWSITLSVDPSLKDAVSPDPPPGIGPFILPLDQPVSLIGRRSEVRAIFPEIPITYDDAVSHRHALLQLDPAGVLQLRDIGSTNGTRLNGRELTPMSDETLKDGDQITLGHWSRISVKAL
jgi:hypothetical protein